MPDGAEIFIPESAAFGADGRRLYVTFPVTVNGKDAGTAPTRSRWTGPRRRRRSSTTRATRCPHPTGALWPTLSLDDGWTHIRKLSGSPRDRRLLKGVVWDWLPDG
ncbi:MAG TPA: hypothetical protein VI006_04405 [Solirubrobacteraceae bacterium]